MWIVVKLEWFYPSVYTYYNKDEASDKYNEIIDTGGVAHFAEVEESNFEENKENLHNKDGSFNIVWD